MAIKIGRIKLVVTISTVFTSLIILFGIIIRQYGYLNTTRILLESSRAEFAQLDQELMLEFSSRQELAGQTISILSKTGVMEAENFKQRLPYVPLIASALSRENGIAALEVGYDSGDFFIVRLLTEKYLYEVFDAPPAARFVVDNINHSDPTGSVMERILYDNNLRELKRVSGVTSGYDPRVRPWFTLAGKPAEIVSTAPYFFVFFRTTGLTLSMRGETNRSVMGADVMLSSLSQVLSRYRETVNYELVLLEKNDDALYIMAHSNPELLQEVHQQGKRFLARDFSASPVIQKAASLPDIFSEVWQFAYKGENWLGSTRLINFKGRQKYYLVALVPEKEMFAEALLLQKRAMHFTLAMLAITVLLTWLFARRISLPILQLSDAADRIRMFQFGSVKRKGSFIKEVDELEHSMNMMQTTISKFISLINSLAGEKDYNRLLQEITRETLDISGATVACTFLFRETANILEPASVYARHGIEVNIGQLPVIPLDVPSKMVDIFNSGERVVIPLSDLLKTAEFRKTMENLGLEGAQNVIVPLKNRQAETIGLLCFTYEKNQSDIHSGKDSGRMAFIEALSGFSAVTLEGRKMLQMQKNLLESFIKLIAGAIDSKSPYTGGHCQRVPVLTKLLAKKACEENRGVFKDFNLNQEQWEELHIASWLHDCGKVTTPEYVVDKATKLETIYDRIHEVRMRFEVLKRDAHIRYYEQLLAGGEPEILKERLEADWQQLDDDFTFVAGCNQGGEFMTPEDVGRLQAIGARKWVRTISDRLGVGWNELQKKMVEPEPDLPAEETLLADRADHIVARNDDTVYGVGNPYGFTLDIPENLYNRGELYNLCTRKGTLTGEERFKINDHIVQTIIMLKQLPYPAHLAGVPDIAGGHHEKIDGTGYPRKTRGEAMSVQAKIMVIADIFEALTASDRPYKKAKSLSESIRILHFMAEDNHVDKDLFKLFLTSGAYLEYGREYLAPEQLDEVDIKRYL